MNLLKQNLFYPPTLYKQTIKHRREINGQTVTLKETRLRVIIAEESAIFHGTFRATAAL